MTKIGSVSGLLLPYVLCDQPTGLGANWIKDTGERHEGHFDRGFF